MSQQKPKSPSRESNTALHPLDLFKPEWTISQQSIGTENLIVQHNIQPPDEIEQPPLVEIALMCGFSSQSAFSRTFSRCVGTSPRKSRQEL